MSPPHLLSVEEVQGDWEGACYRSHAMWGQQGLGRAHDISPSQLQPGLRHHALVSGPG